MYSFSVWQTKIKRRWLCFISDLSLTLGGEIETQMSTLINWTLTMPAQIPNCERGDKQDGWIKRWLLLKILARRFVFVKSAARQIVKLKLTPNRINKQVKKQGLATNGHAHKWQQQIPDRRK